MTDLISGCVLIVILVLLDVAISAEIISKDALLIVKGLACLYVNSIVGVLLWILIGVVKIDLIEYWNKK